MRLLLSNRQIGVIKRLKRQGFKNLFYCPECGSIHHYTVVDYVPYTSHSYYKCKSCKYHIWTGSFNINNIIKHKGEIDLDRTDMHYFSAKHRQHSKTDRNMPKSQRDYLRLHKKEK